MIHLPTDPRPTTSVYFDEDARIDEVRIDGVVNTNTGLWIVARVNPDVADETDLANPWRAYPETAFSHKVGLICSLAPTREQVVEMARTWS